MGHTVRELLGVLDLQSCMEMVGSKSDTGAAHAVEPLSTAEDADYPLVQGKTRP
jgi:hypothetical protein